MQAAAPPSPEISTADSIKQKLQLDSVQKIALPQYTSPAGVTKWCYQLFKNNKIGFLYNGNVIAPAYSKLSTVFEEGGGIYLLVAKNNKYGLIDDKAAIKIPLVYDGLEFMRKKIYRTILNKKAGMIGIYPLQKSIKNKYSRLIFYRYLPVSETILHFMLFEVTLNGKTGYVGENGVEYFKD
jgi:hypothetical protein